MDSSIENILKTNILKARLSTGLNQEEFAEKVGMSRNGYCAIENGKTRILNRNIAAIAGACDISVNELILGAKAVNETNPLLREEISSRDELIRAIKQDYEERLSAKQAIIDQQDRLIKRQENMIDRLGRQLEKND